MATTTKALQPLSGNWDAFLEKIPLETIISVGFTLVFIFLVIYTLISAYHWFRYSHQSWIAVPALALHIFVSGFLLLFSVSGIS